MTNPPFRTEVERIRTWCGGAAAADAGSRTGRAPRQAAEVEAVVADLAPIRSRSSLLSSFAREANPSEPVRAAYAIRWVELGSGIAATATARSRHRRVIRPTLRGRA
jgi:hypothetical protein